MITANEIINGAAEDLGVKTAEISLEAEDYQMFFVRMNDMLLEWADIGLTPSFIEVVNGTDVVSIDSNARSAVKSNLAMRCAASFQRNAPISLAELANRSLARLEASTAFIGNVAYPDSLPIGSGNHCAGDDIEQRFFENNQNENF